jgi:hypothetical protein
MDRNQKQDERNRKPGDVAGQNLNEQPDETFSVANFPKANDQGGKFSPKGKEDQNDWDNAPGEGKPSSEGRTSFDSRVKGPADGQERSGGT